MRSGVGTVRKQQHNLRKRVSSSEPKDLVCTDPAAPGNSQEVIYGEVRRPKTCEKSTNLFLMKQGSRELSWCQTGPGAAEAADSGCIFCALGAHHPTQVGGGDKQDEGTKVGMLGRMCRAP